MATTTLDPHVDPRLRDFRNFLFKIWQHLGLPVPTLIQYDVAQYLDDQDRHRLIIEAFRGVGKSFVTGAYAVHQLYLNPQARIMVVSASKDRADAFAVFVKRLIDEVPWLRHLRPRPGQRDSTLIFDVGPARTDQSPSLKSVGITGAITGSRADLIIADDVETPHNSLTQMRRDRLSELVKEFDAVIKPGGRIVYLGTPQCEMSLYNRLPERGYEVRVWPARYRPSMLKMDKKLAPMIRQRVEQEPELMDAFQGRGASTDPERFDDEDLISREMSYGRTGFALQFMLDTSLADADRYPLRLADLVVMGLDHKRGPVALSWASGPQQVINELPSPGLAGDHFHRPMYTSADYAEYTGCAMWIDPSGRGKDETSYAVVKMLHGNLFLVDCGGFRDGYSESTLRSLAVIAKTNGANYVGVEPNFGDGMFTQLAKPVFAKIHPCQMEEGPRVSQMKEARMIDTLEPLINQHRLVVDEKLIQRDLDSVKDDPDPSYSLFYQLTRVTRERGALKHDDRLDAVAQCVNYWVEQMSQDVAAAEDLHRREMLEKELDRFMESALGSSIGPPTYVPTR